MSNDENSKPGPSKQFNDQFTVRMNHPLRKHLDELKVEEDGGPEFDSVSDLIRWVLRAYVRDRGRDPDEDPDQYRAFG